ncbi:MAG TPA: Asp-tRNA(Asn)/Glu-tRNA(Gln) amidotransferase subunit GatC [Clostridia bacterium]|nr:Asp-tRNA(Asn)/Glu-tRNA(Gln) amidotransferase subunit GatC [Clostridia bacterium]
MKVTIETIEYIANLSKLKFDEQEKERFAKEFESILTHFENIENEDLSTTEVSLMDNTVEKLRKDEVKKFDNRKELFQNVKEIKDGCIVIPRILE